MNPLPINAHIKIVALDDDPFILKVLRQILPEDIDLATALTCIEFHALARDIAPDIILLDLILPDGDGIEICREFRSFPENRDTFVIVITGSTDQETIERGYAAGADDFIRKPFIASELRAKMRMFERIIRARMSLRYTYRTQVDYNRKLFSLSTLIEKNLKNRDTLAAFRTAEYLYEIIDSIYIELVHEKDGEHVSLIRKSILDEENPSRPAFRTFDELDKTTALSTKSHEGTKLFRIQSRGRVIHCCLCTLALTNRQTGYILLENIQPYSAEDREILTLFTGFFTLLANRFRIEKVIEDMNCDFKAEISKIRKIQVSMMPDFVSIPGYDISATYLPAQDLSGDFFDGFYIDENIYQIVLCDVAGHGISSSYVGNEIRTLFRIASTGDKNPAQIATEVNASLSRDMEGLAYYCTAIILQIYFKEGIIKYLNAGHPSALYCKADGKSCLTIEQTGPIIGLFNDNQYDYQEIHMEDRDTMLLYTDGLTEACSEGGSEMFGENRLTDSFITTLGRSSRDINHFLVGTLYEFVDYSEQVDDITILCIRRDASREDITLF